ncbi:MAG: hypothetical protein O2816_16250, partial [Planctomycetota bacterium]|nr:hypothetical protein [Planctomycetota bacterium]
AGEDDRALLLSLLAALDVSVHSQTTVFSRTSFQPRRISPARPRGVYFNDEVYVGYVPGSGLFELTVMDPDQGLRFYTLTRAEQGLAFQRETHSCLQCHAPSWNRERPAHLVRSVHPLPDGQAQLRAGTHLVDHRTPYEDRWGGWYVTGAPEGFAHLGNQLLGEDEERLAPAGVPRVDLEGLCDLAPYPVATSDLIALLVLEHQTHVHTVLATAGAQVRDALADQRELNRSLGRPDREPLRSTTVRIEGAGRRAAEALLFVGEPRLPVPIEGDSPFARSFLSRSLRDEDGRGLRDLELRTRLFRYRLSYLIHSPTFAALPAELRDRVWLELWMVLEDVDGACRSLPMAECHTIRAHLEATRDDLPAYW